MNRLGGSLRRFGPLLVTVSFLSLPLVWGACAGPTPGATPAVSLDEKAGGTMSGEPAGDDSSPPPVKATPKPTGTMLDAATMKAIDAQLAKLPPRKTGPLTFQECAAVERPAQAAVSLALKAAGECKADSDCVLASDGTCVTGMCGASVAKAHKDAFDATIKHVADVACPAWKSGDCDTTNPRPVPSCAMPQAHCEKGQCSP